TVDTNSAFAGKELAAIGVKVVRRTAVADTPEAIRAAVDEALARTGAVLTTGGLGPTRDDISKVEVARLFDAPLEFRPEIWDAIVERFKRFGRVPGDNNRTQAEMPRGALELRNQWGSAPGIWLEGPRGLVIMLPGVPREMRNLLTHEVLPRLAARGGRTVVRSRTVRTTAIGESVLAERMGEIEREVAPLTLAYLPDLGAVDLRVTAWDLPADEADRRLAEAVALLRTRAGDHAFGEGSTDLAEVLLAEAKRLRVTIATAESCTGGLVGGRLTAIPGSSDAVVGGIIAYGNQVKERELGVPAAMLAEHGAVSEPVARAMAEGAAARLGAGLTLAVTGIAGPGGGTAEKPVGTVWFATHYRGVTKSVKQIQFGERDEIRARSAQVALYLMWRRLLEDQVPR
ncbi:MAG TPA: CinA family nicotinamide mononucleotide deamidase-related protein, partial [Anaeromyxobacteraceae bacterium]|nr:CinA family nicotinamide mononucleotide deamidase-related protein [Anaeromyxobacteraceae bacterium]